MILSMRKPAAGWPCWRLRLVSGHPAFLDCFDKIAGNTGGLRLRGGGNTPTGGHAAAYDTVARRVSGATRRGDRSAQYAFLAKHDGTRTKFTLPDQLTARIRAAISQASDHADNLATALNTAHNLAATLHAAGPAAPRRVNGKASSDHRRGSSAQGLRPLAL